MDINAPLYWWKEYDTYKVAAITNSTSTMHTIHSKAFSIEDFSTDKMTIESVKQIQSLIDFLETLRLNYLKTKDKELWYSMIQILPSSYNQLRTCTLNYETLINIYYSRRNHKLDEWHELCDWIRGLPYAKQLIIDIN